METTAAHRINATAAAAATSFHCLGGHPLLLSHPYAPHRYRWAFPNATFVALLRDPVERAWSQYRMEFDRGTEGRTFLEAVSQEAAQLQRCMDRRRSAAEPLPSWAADALDYCAVVHFYPTLVPEESGTAASTPNHARYAALPPFPFPTPFNTS